MAEGTTNADSATVIRGVLHLLSRTVVARFTGLLSSIVLARLLAPEEFGRAAVAMSIVSIAVFFLDSGLTAAALRSKEEPSVALLRALSGVQLMLTALAVVVIVPIAFLGSSPALTITALALLPLMSLQTPLFIVAERRLDFHQVSNADLAANLGSQALTLTLAVLGAGVWALVVGAVARPLFSGLWMAPRVDPRVLIPTWRFSPAFPLLRDGLRLQIMPASMMLRDQGSTLIAAAFVGSATLGVWILVGRLLAVPAAVYGALGRVAYPTMAARSRDGSIDGDQIQRGMRRIAFASAWLLGLVCAGSIYGVPLIFGDSWRSAVPAVLATCPGMLIITAVSTPSLSLLMVERRVGGPTVGVVLHAIVAWGIVVLGPFGRTALTIGLATTAGALAESAVLLYLMHKRGLSWRSSLGAVVPALVMGAGAVALGYLVALPLPSDLVSSLVAPVIATLVLAGATVAFFRDDWAFARRHLARRRGLEEPDDVGPTPASG